MKKYLVVNGPNMNMLGTREPEIYGLETLADIEKRIREVAEELQVSVDFFQSNFEGEIIECLHKGYGVYDGIVFNPAAFTNYSIAIRDALAAVKIPFIEVHISNLYARESFRHISVFAALAVGQISGLGTYGYEAALRALVRR
jgi:3-dehydroquinate dehydratase-2